MQQMVIRTDAKLMDAALKLAGVVEDPMPVPQGELGGCIACGHTVLSHFKDGRFVGCLKASANTVFVLVPVDRKETRGKVGATPAPAVSHERTTSAKTGGTSSNNGTEPAIVARGFVRARYFTKVHHKSNLEKLPLSPTRLKALKAVHEAGKAGLRAKDIMKRAKLPHGSVQQTMNWLRAHQLVEAREDATTS